MKLFFNKTTKKRVDVDFSTPTPRIGETISFGEEILKVIDVHYGVNLEEESYFVDITVENNYTQ